MELLKAELRGKTLVLVSHHQEDLALVDLLYRIEAGELIAVHDEQTVVP